MCRYYRCAIAHVALVAGGHNLPLPMIRVLGTIHVLSASLLVIVVLTKDEPIDQLPSIYKTRGKEENGMNTKLIDSPVRFQNIGKDLQNG